MVLNIPLPLRRIASSEGVAKPFPHSRQGQPDDQDR